MIIDIESIEDAKLFCRSYFEGIYRNAASFEQNAIRIVLTYYAYCDNKNKYENEFISAVRTYNDLMVKTCEVKE